MSLRDEKRELLRNQLLDAAEALFRARGFDETRIEEIAKSALVSRQTFFNYFRTKEQVLREVGLRWLTRGIGRSHTELAADRSSEPGAIDQLRRNLRRQAKDIEADRDFMALVYTRSGVILPQGKPPPDDAARLELTRRGFEAFASPFRQAQRAGEIRSDVDPLQIAEMLFGIQSMTTRLWLMNYWKSSGRLHTRLIRAFDLLIDGLRP